MRPPAEQATDSWTGYPVEGTRKGWWPQVLPLAPASRTKPWCSPYCSRVYLESVCKTEQIFWNVCSSTFYVKLIHLSNISTSTVDLRFNTLAWLVGPRFPQKRVTHLEIFGGSNVGVTFKFWWVHDLPQGIGWCLPRHARYVEDLRQGWGGTTLVHLVGPASPIGVRGGICLCTHGRSRIPLQR